MAMPIVAGMGGNSGNQVLAVTIRSIALEKLKIRRHWKYVFVEITVGLINGLLMGTIAAMIIFIKFKSISFSFVILISMVCNFVIANTMGFLIFLSLSKLIIDVI